MFLLISASALAQTPVRFEGLRRTQATFLSQRLNDLDYRAGVTTLAPSGRATDSVYLAALRQQLINLPQVREATYTLRGDTLVWTIREAATRAPLFSFGGVRGNLNVLVGFSDQHLFGRGHHLEGFYQNNQGRHNYLLRYRNPGIRGSRIGFGVESRRYAALEPVYFGGAAAALDYDYTNQSFGATLSYELRARERVSIGVTTFRERFVRAGASSLEQAPDFLELDKLLFKVEHERDRRDWIDERVRGRRHVLTAETVVSAGESAFAIAFAEGSDYRLVGARGNLANRVRLGLATNRNSPFAPFTLDSQLNIRGSGNRIDRGTAQVVWNLEYRHRVYADKRGNFRGQVVAFSDFGAWRSPGGELSELATLSSLQHFVGAGLRLTSARARNAVLRVDYGVDWRNEGRRGLVFGFGQYF